MLLLVTVLVAASPEGSSQLAKGIAYQATSLLQVRVVGLLLLVVLLVQNAGRLQGVQKLLVYQFLNAGLPHRLFLPNAVLA